MSFNSASSIRTKSYKLLKTYYCQFWTHCCKLFSKIFFNRDPLKRLYLLFLTITNNLMVIFRETLDSATDRCLAVLSSLATILSKVFKLRSPTALSLLERCPTYVSKEKKSSRMFPRAKKSTLVSLMNLKSKKYVSVSTKYLIHRSMGIISSQPSIIKLPIAISHSKGYGGYHLKDSDVHVC
jgi:hypothetical protein